METHRQCILASLGAVCFYSVSHMEPDDTKVPVADAACHTLLHDNNGVRVRIYGYIYMLA
jgi:hypothetical protein